VAGWLGGWRAGGRSGWLGGWCPGGRSGRRGSCRSVGTGEPHRQLIYQMTFRCATRPRGRRQGLGRAWVRRMALAGISRAPSGLGGASGAVSRARREFRQRGQGPDGEFACRSALPGARVPRHGLGGRANVPLAPLRGHRGTFATWGVANAPRSPGNVVRGMLSMRTGPPGTRPGAFGTRPGRSARGRGVPARGRGVRARGPGGLESGLVAGASGLAAGASGLAAGASGLAAPGLQARGLGPPGPRPRASRPAAPGV
jgi:hypothetical protein